MSDLPWGGPYAAHSGQRNPTHAPAQPYGGAYAGRGSQQHPPQTFFGEEPQAQPAVPQQPAPLGAGFARLAHGAGAILSIALIAGLANWGYKLAMRDVTGVPVVRALQGPMRIQPADPGGVVAAHQGLAVNAIAADGQAEGPAPEVVLAPAQMTLLPGDEPAHAAATVSAAQPAPAVAEPFAEPLADDEDAISVAAPDQNPAAADQNPAAAAVDPVAAAADTVLASAVVPASVPGVTRSPRPVPRPDDIVTRAEASPVDLAVASASAAALPGVREIDPSQVPAGTRLVQLGAFEDQKTARGEWDKLALRFPEMLEGKDRVIEQAQSGGKTFYRLRAMGFGDISDARRFCSALNSGQAPCIPVVTR